MEKSKGRGKNLSISAIPFVPKTFVPETFVPKTFVPKTFVPEAFIHKATESTYTSDHLIKFIKSLAFKGITWNMMSMTYCNKFMNFCTGPNNYEENENDYMIRKTHQLEYMKNILVKHKCDFALLQEADIFWKVEEKYDTTTNSSLLEQYKLIESEYYIQKQIPPTGCAHKNLVILYKKERFGGYVYYDTNKGLNTCRFKKSNGEEQQYALHIKVETLRSKVPLDLVSIHIPYGHFDQFEKKVKEIVVHCYYDKRILIGGDTNVTNNKHLAAHTHFKYNASNAEFDHLDMFYTNLSEITIKIFGQFDVNHFNKVMFEQNELKFLGKKSPNSRYCLYSY